MLKYKLTNQDNTTYNNTKWEIGKPIETDGKIKQLCTSSWLHFYHTPELAILMNPNHANISNPRLYECEVEGEILDNDYGLKAGCIKMTLIREIEKPTFNHRQLVSISLEFTKYCFEFNDEITKHYSQKCIELIEKWLIDSNSVTQQDLLNAANAAVYVAYYVANAANAARSAANAAYAASSASSASYNAAYASRYVSCADWYASNAISYAAQALNTDYIKLQEIIRIK